MKKITNIDWRQQQKNFFSGEVEFIQDQRILDFFDSSPVLGIGAIEYFKDKLNIIEDDKTKYNQCLVIINKNTSNTDLINLIRKLNNIKKICLSINKFLIHTKVNNKDIIDDYDQALFLLIEQFFKNRNIEHYFVKGLKGDNFNFASPTTQFFIT